MVVEKEQEYEFWPDSIAKELISSWKVKRQIIVTGTSMSGDPHIGNANDIIRGDAIKLAVKNLNKLVELIWISDDMDPFRSVPADLPKDLENYLGIPACNIPDFWKCHQSFTEHFEQKLLRQLKAVNIEPKVLLGIEMYKSGMYNSVMKVAMKKREEIAKIINKYRTTPLPDDWYPVDIICGKCGKISTTKILKYYATGEVDYLCDPKEILLHRKNPVAGCGNRDKVSILNGGGKLTWRVEWPARWVFLKTTCEPFGKEHAAAGGSWDTGKEIVKILGWKPPYPVIYEHFLVNGEKMSKSKGNVITVDDMLKYMPPSHLRYWMFQGRLTIAKDIKLSIIIPKLFDEFDKAERIFFKEESTNDKRKDNNYRRAYELAVISPPKKKKPVNLPFDKLVEINRIAPEENREEFVSNKLKEIDHSIDKEVLGERIRYVDRWMKDFVKNEEKTIKLDNKERELVQKIVKMLQEESDQNIVQSKLFEIIKSSGVETSRAFKLIYNILLNSDRGPRLGQYIIEAGKEQIIKKLGEFL